MREPITITLLNNDISLDRICWVCEGGKIKYSKKARHQGFWVDGACDMCKGKGYILTEAGQGVIDLIKRHLG